MKFSRREFVAGGAALAALELTGCGPQRAPGVPATPEIETLRAVGARQGILAGCAVQVQHLRNDPAYAALVAQQAGIIVEESALKMGPLRPSLTEYSFDKADYLFDFAAKHKMKVRGHNFVWHEQMPKWFDSYVTPANAERVLVEHIEHVGGRYAGRVHSWDVVNEAILLKDGLPGGFRNSAWQKLLPGHGTSSGAVPAYIEIAFRTARRVDPKAMLVYNDYGIEGADAQSEAKRRAVMNLLRAMQAKQIPIDALGVQSHLSARGEWDGQNTTGLRAMMAEARAMGLKVLITEMDVSDRRLPGGIAARDQEIGQVYGRFLQSVLAEEAVIALLTWGITDKYTWLDYGNQQREDKLPQRCLPFDAEMNATPAFFAEREALASAAKRIRR